MIPGYQRIKEPLPNTEPRTLRTHLIKWLAGKRSIVINVKINFGGKAAITVGKGIVPGSIIDTVDFDSFGIILSPHYKGMEPEKPTILESYTTTIKGHGYTSSLDINFKSSEPSIFQHPHP